MAYDRAPDTHDPADADALKARREALRAFVAEIADIAQTLQLPETYLEAERAARALTVADRAVQVIGALTLGDVDGTDPSPSVAVEPRHLPMPSAQGGGNDTLHTDTKRLSLKLRAYADRVMEAVTFIPKPDTFLEVERAQRYALSAERLLTQLYVAPKAKSRTARFAFDIEDSYDPDGEDIPELLRGSTPEQLDDLRAQMPDGRLPVTTDDWAELLERKIAPYRAAHLAQLAKDSNEQAEDERVSPLIEPPPDPPAPCDLQAPEAAEDLKDLPQPDSVFATKAWRNHYPDPCNCALTRTHCAPGSCPHALSP